MKKNIPTFLKILLLLIICMSLNFVPVSNQSLAASKKKVSLNYTKVGLDKKRTQQLQLTNYSGTVKWKSSKPKVASVSKTGLVKAKSYGKAKITATAGKKKYKCTVYVEKPSISEKSIQIEEKSSYKLSMKNTIRTPYWSSDNSKVAVVAYDGTVTGCNAGTTTIRAKLGKKTYSCTVQVTDGYYRHTVDEAPESITTDANVLGVLQYVNNLRAQYNLPALVLDRNLTNAANARALECAQKYSHTRPDGTDFYSILDTGEYKMIYDFAYENIANGQEDAYSVVDEWFRSSAHKAAILTEDTTITGIGYCEINGKKYCVKFLYLFHNLYRI